MDASRRSGRGRSPESAPTGAGLSGGIDAADSDGFSSRCAVAGRISSSERELAMDKQPGVQAAQGGVGGGPSLPSWNGITSVAQVAARSGR